LSNNVTGFLFRYEKRLLVFVKFDEDNHLFMNLTLTARPSSDVQTNSQTHTKLFSLKTNENIKLNDKKNNPFSFPVSLFLDKMFEKIVN
jgi:hypothetical protein